MDAVPMGDDSVGDKLASPLNFCCADGDDSVGDYYYGYFYVLSLDVSNRLVVYQAPGTGTDNWSVTGRSLDGSETPSTRSSLMYVRVSV